jgi:3-hydroxybutyrate dehydrogenase
MRGNQSMSLTGKVALVTGSTSGIGLGIAGKLAEAGADVMLNGFCRPGEQEKLAASLASQHGVRVSYHGADLRHPAQVAAMVEHTESEFGALDILINNAGIQHTANIEEFPPEKWDEILAVNLSAVFHAIKVVIPRMKARGWGRIVNIASVHGLVGSPQKCAYVAAKHGLVGLTKVAAIESANAGITVNAICPGWVWTPLVEQQVQRRAVQARVDLEVMQRQFLAEKQPMTRFSTPEQIGALAVFLCSEQAASITGASFPVDGGWTAQ